MMNMFIIIIIIMVTNEIIMIVVILFVTLCNNFSRHLSFRHLSVLSGREGQQHSSSSYWLNWKCWGRTFAAKINEAGPGMVSFFFG